MKYQVMHGIRLAYGHLPLANSKGQCQSHAHFDDEYLGNNIYIYIYIYIVLFEFYFGKLFDLIMLSRYSDKLLTSDLQWFQS